MKLSEDWYPASSQRALKALYRRVAGLAGDVVEVGCWEGRSTIVLAAAAYPEVVHAVDTWRGSPSDVTGQLAAERDIYAAFQANTRDLNITAHRMDWSEYFAHNRSPVKFCHIDGEHTYEQVDGNIEAVLRVMVPGGMFAGDDIHHPPVREAVADRLGRYQTLASLWYWTNT